MAERRSALALRTGLAAATVTGLVSAIITRLLMRAIALVVNDEPEFSLIGSAGIAMIYVVALLPGCLALALTHARWPWILFCAGAGLLMFEAVAIGIQETATGHDMTPWRWFGLVTLLLLMATTYCAQFVVAAQWARRQS